MTGPTEMPLGLKTHVGLKNHVIDGMYIGAMLSGEYD